MESRTAKMAQMRRCVSEAKLQTFGGQRVDCFKNKTKLIGVKKCSSTFCIIFPIILCHMKVKGQSAQSSTDGAAGVSVCSFS